MTVGLVLNNRDYGVALADSMVTIGDYRKGDTANKLLHINAKQFYGAMVGAGDAMNIFASFEKIRETKYGSITKMLSAIKDHSLEYRLSLERQVNDAEKKIMKANGIKENEMEIEFGEDEGDDEKGGKTRRKKSRRKRKLPGIEDYVTSDFAVALFDKKEGKIKKYYVCSLFYIEDPIFETAIGSGADSAGLELLRLLSGVPLSKLHKCEIAFFGLCAYVRATQNVGVGGIPKIALIDKDSSTIVSREDSIALANITAAYHADLLPRAYAEHHAELVLRGQGKYAEVAQVLNMNEFTLKNLLTPLDGWLNLANSLRYPSAKCDRKCKEKGCDGKCRKKK